MQPHVGPKLFYPARRGSTWLFLFSSHIFVVYFLSSSRVKENLSDKIEEENRNDKDKPLLAWHIYSVDSRIKLLFNRKYFSTLSSQHRSKESSNRRDELAIDEPEGRPSYADGKIPNK